MCPSLIISYYSPEVGIYKRKQKVRKQELDQESDQESKEKERKLELDQESDQGKEKKLSFFSCFL